MASCVIQVTNIAPTVTVENLRNFFAHVGTVREFAMYPNLNSPQITSPTNRDTSRKDARACYIKFLTPTSAAVAQHLSKTVFNEWAIEVKQHTSNDVPDEITALRLALQANARSAGTGVVNSVSSHNGNQVLLTVDPRFVELGLPPYPPLLATLEPTKVEEIRRTISVTNISESTSPEDLVTFFNQFGEVKYVRMTCPENDVIKTALVEFTDQSTMVKALQKNGTTYKGNAIGIAHSTIAILKPKFPERRGYDSRGRRRSRTPDRRRRSRSPRRRSRSPRRRSRSPYGRRRRSRSRSTSRDRLRRRERSPHERSRERERERERRERERERERERDRDRRRSVDRTDRGGRRDRERSPRERSRDRDRRRRDRDSPSRRERSKSRERRARKEDGNSQSSSRRDRRSRSQSMSRGSNAGTGSHPSSGQILTFSSLIKEASETANESPLQPVKEEPVAESMEAESPPSVKIEDPDETCA